MNKKRKMLLCSTIVVITIVVVAFLLNYKFNIIEKIIKIGFKNEETIKISYQVYDNSTANKLKTLITINDIDGIDYVEYSNNKVIGNNKKQISFDYVMDKDQNYIFKVKSIDNENIYEYTINANDDFINDNGVKIDKLKEQNGYKVIDIDNMISIDGYKTYYKIGKNSDWIEGTGKIALHDYDLKSSNLVNDDNTVTISAKIENTKNSQAVTLNKKFEVDTNQTEGNIEAESLISAVEKDDIKTGLYNVSVNDEIYNLKVYSFDSNLNLDTNSAFGSEQDVATANEYAKNMIVLKVNGDLTIDDGVTLTSYASKDGFGGTKGMFIYCTGTLTNNGTISMTARGAKAKGQNVYLWKNADNSYEYVPAVGAEGGEGQIAVTSEYTNKYNFLNGNSGRHGYNRETGGGGSGTCAARVLYFSALTGVTQNGGMGTSYSGGTGGGGTYHSNYQGGDGGGYRYYSGEKGSDNGGTGGKSTTSRIILDVYFISVV